MEHIFIDGSHSSCEELSWFKRPALRGAQPMEGFNRAKNDLSKLERNGERTSLKSWLGLAKALEKLQLDRLEELLDGAEWKKKNSLLIAKDKACASVVKKLHRGEITSAQYIRVVRRIMGNFD